MTKLHGGKVASVEPGSIAEEAGIQPGDLIVSIDGHPLSDIIDYRFYSAEERVEVVVHRDEEELVVTVEKDYDDPLGVEFEDQLFDGVYTCDNRCVFCFVHQLPRGMRRSLYLKDDDYRLSFLHGNFVTLSNVGEPEMRRIVEQRLSPLYISVHTTDPELRGRMLRGRSVQDVMRQLRALAEGGITLHTQIVVCPGLNDGEHLVRTVTDLASLYPGVVSIGIVPVGLTEHRRIRPQIERVDSEGARKLVRLVNKWQREFRGPRGTRLVWASDELYLLAGLPVPGIALYEGFPQLENGIGIVRRFIDDARRMARWLPERVPYPIRATVVTGVLAQPVVQDLATILNEAEHLTVDVVAIKNRFFGGTVTVAGLLTGRDVLDQLQYRDLGDLVILPDVMLSSGPFLDDLTLEELASALGRPVIAVEPRPRALAERLIEESAGASGQPHLRNR